MTYTYCLCLLVSKVFSIIGNETLLTQIQKQTPYCYFTMASEQDAPHESAKGGEPVPMFQASNPNAITAGNFSTLDLDDLFVDCYFGVPGMNDLSAGNDAAAAVADPVSAGNAAASETVAGDRKRTAAEADLEGNDDSTKELTAKQKLERRERNREHAKRSRLRKKFLLESLQEQIHALQEQMEQMKSAIKTELPHKADAIIDGICGDKEKYTPLPMPSGFGPVKTLMEPDFRLMSALSGSQQNFAISDPTLPDNPIVYVSQGFLDLTGYTLDQVLGRNCRFLQGPGTDQSAVDVIRKGIKEGIDTSVCLLNYKADGTPFWNQFFVAALRDAANNVVNYVGVQCEVSKAVVEKHMDTTNKVR